MNVLLSIKPKYANAILAKVKKVEFRKISFKKEVERVYIYSSAPEQRIIGYFVIDKIVQDSPEELWKKYNDIGSISYDDFFEYFAERKIGYSIIIKEVKQFRKAKDPKVIFDNFVPPQSYMYCDEI